MWIVTDNLVKIVVKLAVKKPCQLEEFAACLVTFKIAVKRAIADATVDVKSRLIQPIDCK